MANDDIRRFLTTGTMLPRDDPQHCAQWQAWDARGSAVHPENFPVARALRGERVFPGLQMLYHADNGDEIWTTVLSAPLQDAGGRVNGAIVVVIDIDRFKRLQDQQRLLVAELQHRTRNLLAVVRNIARRSIDPSPGRDEYDARLAALGRVQSFLSRSATYSAALADIVAAELQATGDWESDKIVVGGPPVQLPGASVQTVALALHELATNAVKYGAIGQPEAQLSVTWRLEPGQASKSAQLVIDWKESGVTMRDASLMRRGYGSELIERALPYQLRAETALEFTADGVRCRVVLPADAFKTEMSEDVP